MRSTLDDGEHRVGRLSPMLAETKRRRSQKRDGCTRMHAYYSAHTSCLRVALHPKITNLVDRVHARILVNCCNVTGGVDDCCHIVRHLQKGAER